jgi:cation diffusion facilitator family transporter
MDITPWQHAHTFGQDVKQPGEGRTIVVIVLTLSMMVIEVVTGVLFGSMALLADGLHMASHSVALSINAFAYIYARRHAVDSRYSFGTGKVNALGGYAGAILLAIFALFMVWESGSRMIFPVKIAINQAIAVAIVGLIVNGASMLILGHGHEHGEQDHEEDHHHDHNLRSAYLHVLADALTSFLAIFALLGAKYFGLIWMDPLMGFVGAALIFKWSLGLLRATSGVLLDREGPENFRQRIRESLEADQQTRVTDLHLWSVAPNRYSLIVAVLSRDGKTPDHFKQLLPSDVNLVHASIEVNTWPEGSDVQA